MANDWHASLVPVYLAAKYRPHGVYENARSVLAIHNLRHQVRASSDCPSCSYNRCFWSTYESSCRLLAINHQPLANHPNPQTATAPFPQGVFPPHTFNDLGLPGHWYGAVEYQYPPHQVGWYMLGCRTAGRGGLERTAVVCF